MILWVGWWLVLTVQKGLNTVAQRAKNGDDLRYSGITAVLSDGVYVCTLGFTINALVKGTNFWQVATAYTSACLVGTVLFHWLALKLERDNEHTS